MYRYAANERECARMKLYTGKIDVMILFTYYFTDEIDLDVGHHCCYIHCIPASTN